MPNLIWGFFCNFKIVFICYVSWPCDPENLLLLHEFKTCMVVLVHLD